jgi:hypothetical protein
MRGGSTACLGRHILLKTISPRKKWNFLRCQIVNRRGWVAVNLLRVHSEIFHRDRRHKPGFNDVQHPHLQILDVLRYKQQPLLAYSKHRFRPTSSPNLTRRFNKEGMPVPPKQTILHSLQPLIKHDCPTPGTLISSSEKQTKES